jgi:hypothetical protein
MHIVTKAFPTGSKFFVEGAIITPEDCPSRELFQRYIELGYVVEKTPATAPAPEKA